MSSLPRELDRRAVLVSGVEGGSAVCKRMQIRSYPTLVMISPRFDMHATWPNRGGKWAEQLPAWARETRDEWCAATSEACCS